MLLHQQRPIRREEALVIDLVETIGRPRQEPAQLDTQPTTPSSLALDWTVQGEELPALDRALHQRQVLGALAHLQVPGPGIELVANPLLLGEEALDLNRWAVAAGQLRLEPVPALRAEERAHAQAERGEMD